MSDEAQAPALRAVALNCTLKRGTETSSTDVLLREVLDALGQVGVEAGEPFRVVNHDVMAGVTSDEGDGDEWPTLRDAILEADILVLATPIWLGQPSSVAKRVLERMDAFLGETGERGQMVSYGRVAIVAVVGNEDGAHHVTAELFQALNDVGFTVPANGGTYWTGEAMQSLDYKDVHPRPAKTMSTTVTAAVNAAHLARLLRERPYPKS